MANDQSIFTNPFAASAEALNRIAEMPYHYHTRELVSEFDKIKLYHYASDAKKIHREPLLIVFSTINRPEILEFNARASFIGSLLENGMDVYLLDWGYPDQKDSHITFSDYVENYTKKCVEKILARQQLDKINLLGICQGGVISLLYSLKFEHINKLTLISTPINFQTKDDMAAQLISKIDSQLIEGVSHNIPGAMLTQFFISLRPYEINGKKMLHALDNLHDSDKTERFLRMEKWLHDTPDQPAKAWAEFVTDYYCKNSFMSGKVDLNKLRTPVLNIIAREDKIVPPAASTALRKFLPLDLYSQSTIEGGHIGIYINENTTKKLAKKIAGWLKKHQDDAI